MNKSTSDNEPMTMAVAEVTEAAAVLQGLAAQSLAADQDGSSYHRSVLEFLPDWKPTILQE
jgi:hypothetical protein